MNEEARKLVELLRDEDNCNVLDYIDDAAALIESLSAQLEQVTRERDAAVAAFESNKRCETCPYYGHGENGQWRGVEVEG